ncbi:DUF5996 family protein [Streptomyces anulatus]|uniref:DUF5996 family protein n=1 Tax=Streptomyces anulatus TaxID=1892 RepID=A0ABZ1ZRN3_STRAQ|nr:DUF5996 family protein [Streptomyces anulatus]
MQRQPLEPAAARWTENNGSDLALLPYDDVRTAPDAPAEILQFCDTAYVAGARLAGWNTDRLCPGGSDRPPGTGHSTSPAQNVNREESAGDGRDSGRLTQIRTRGRDGAVHGRAP